jgi:hypothetical protein
MVEFVRGPTSEYLVTWKNGCVENIHAHQVMEPYTSVFLAYGNGHIVFHKEIDGKWVMILSAHPRTIDSVRFIGVDD